MPPDPIIAEAEFHAEGRPFYTGGIGWAVVKRSDRMARVAYEPNHPNEQETGARAGRGRTVARWVFCERPDDGEGLFSTPLHLVIEASLDPHASIGLHTHDESEEFYYLVEGNLTLTTVGSDGREETTDLEPGDAHACLLGQSHHCVAGPQGARVLSVSLRPGGAAERDIKVTTRSSRRPD